MAASFCCNSIPAIHAQMNSACTRKKLCEAILEELGLPSHGAAADLVDPAATASG